MPFYNLSRRTECMTETIDALSVLENIIEVHPLHEVIIGGDTNCELNGSSPFDPLWADMLTKFELASSTFTYCHNLPNHRKWNDHVFMNKSLIEANCLKNHQILDDGDNTSDHLPIIMTLSTTSVANVADESPSLSKDSIEWGKLSTALCSQCTQRVSALVDAHQVLAAFHQCQSRCRCDDRSCQEGLQMDYDLLMSCLKDADASLPRHKPGLKKDW